MTKMERYCTRRRVLLAAAGSTAVAALGRSHVMGAEDSSKTRSRKMILSFYCDDTSPHVAGAKAFETFLDYCAKQGVAGEASAILGTGGHSMCPNPDKEEKAFLEQVARAWECGIGTQMELMTHRGLFDFDANREKAGAVHEGLWLYEPAVTVREYQRYFGAILSEGQRAGVRFTGLTWPGCSCEACTKRYAELRASGHRAPNPAMWEALLNLAKEGKFRGRTVPCFFDSSETEGAIHRKASDGAYGVYDLMPNAGDHFGIWENNPKRVDPDYYITADGKSGIIIRHLQSGAPYCIWYSHWQGLNPAKGVGWPAFTTVVGRIDKYLRGQVVWLRPSEITDRYQAAGGWSFLENL
jgi:hypothetical protein